MMRKIPQFFLNRRRYERTAWPPTGYPPSYLTVCLPVWITICPHNFPSRYTFLDTCSDTCLFGYSACLNACISWYLRVWMFSSPRVWIPVCLNNIGTECTSECGSESLIFCPSRYMRDFLAGCLSWQLPVLMPSCLNTCLPTRLRTSLDTCLLAYCTSMVACLPTKLTLSERPAFLPLWKSSSLDICLSGNCPYGWLLPYPSG